MINPMDPATVSVSVAALNIIKLIDWKKIAEGFATDTVRDRAKSVLHRLEPTEQEKATKLTCSLFAHEFLTELEDKTPFTSAIPGYQDQLKRLIEHAAPDIAEWMQPETKDIDLAPIARMWTGLGLDPLPENFDWPLVATNFARAIRKHIKSDPELRSQLSLALQQQQSETLDRIAGPAAGFHLTEYRNFLRQKCAALQLAVMHTSTYKYDRRISLWNVFVEQSARESVPVREMPRELIRRLRQEGHLTRDPDERELSELRERFETSSVRPVFEILQRERRVVIVGDPGSGKTSLLKYLVLRWVEQDTGPLPLWVDLKEYVHDRKGLLKYLDAGFATFRLEAGEIEKRLESGNAALYLDGLDEIFDGPTRGAVIEEISAFSARYSQTPVVITSRTVGYEPERLRNAGFAHATIEEFDDAQVRTFLQRWHIVAEEEAKERARLQAQLERALGDSRAIRDLAGNPLLLTMMAILNRNQDLPRDRVELYREASRVLLHEWDASRSLPVDTFGRQEKEGLLRELAGCMQKGEAGLAGNLIERAQLLTEFQNYLSRLGVVDPFAKARDLIHTLTERNFILCYAGADRFSFVHRTFLEYFCACWFVEQVRQTLSLDTVKEVFERRWKDKTWHEVLRLIAGMITENQAEELIQMLMAQDGRSHKQANLMLAAGCLSEVRNRRALQRTDQALRQRFVDEVVFYEPPYYYEPWEAEQETGPTRRKAVGLFTFGWRDRRVLVSLLSVTGGDGDEIVRQAAVQELARGWKGHPETLPLLKDGARSHKDEHVRQAAVQELARGWKDDPETLPLLKDRARSDKHWDVRQAAVQELARGWKDDPETLPWLKDRARSGEDLDVQKAAMWELVRGWKDDPETLPWLKDCARSDDLDAQKVATRELARGWKDDPQTLPWLKDRARSDKHWSVRQAAVQELAGGWKDDPETLPLLKDGASSDKDEHVRQAAAQELARGWKDDPETLPLLKDRARSDKHWDVRQAAVQELARGWKDDPETLAWLKDRARSDKHWTVRQAAVQELAEGWKDDQETLPWLKDRVRSDEHWRVRQAAVQGMVRGWKDDPETLPLLKDRARLDEDLDIRQAALRELARGWKDDPETLPLLKDRARSDEDLDVRQVALHELARGWKNDPEVRILLEQADTIESPPSRDP
jgi:predicted NACHT family NTPase